MSAISAAAMRCRTMSDGSLRIEVEVEPNDAQAAFAMFGRPGAPMALAALVEGHAAVKEPEAYTAADVTLPKGGDRARWLAMRCADAKFQHWLRTQFPNQARLNPAGNDVDHAASIVRAVCSIESRRELDNDAAAYARFESLIRKPWSAFNNFNGVMA